MDEALQQCIAFTMENLGIFECKCMPFVLWNASATFQRLMQNCLEELNLMYCLIYLDDMIVLSKTEEEHLQHLHIVFDCFREHNLRLKIIKCWILQEWNQLLGSSCLQGGSLAQQMESKSCCRIHSTPNVHRNQGVLGSVGYYWWFIKGFVKIAQPLHEHLSREGASK